MIRSLSPKARGQIYHTLARYPQNTEQDEAFRFPANQLDDWLDNPKLSAPLRDQVRQLMYSNGRLSFFADLHIVLKSIPTAEDRVQLIKTLSRESTLLIRLHVHPDSDIDALAAYWGVGGRAKDVRPILESLQDVGGYTIDIAHLLPGFARRRIYTYPRPTDGPSATAMDCHWTAVNFFRDQPDDRFLDRKAVLETIEKEYYPIYGNLGLGDLILFVKPGERLIHTAVYIADDIVYTKNGSATSQPWMFMKLDDLKDFYPTNEPIEIRYHRRKEL